jgi:chromosome segregation protein
LLKLRKIELTGFKSFSERTILSLGGQGITCIVGPNGCGKSNIVDAITWVLGEQSHKSLRAERMADCISNGSATRPPVGMAEVSLTMLDPELAEAAEKILGRAEQAATSNETHPEGEESQAPAPALDPATDASPAANPAKTEGRRKKTPSVQLNPGEVVVTRRLYRSGQSEYLINGRSARLRDIQELFMEMGLGPNSYAIIEQGRIGQILSSRPAERRAILEEAAGVSKFKTKKRLAEAKLESSKTNLSRINDILAEVTKQLGSLKRQAARAHRYTELREELRRVLASVLASKWNEMRADAERLSLQLDALRQDEASQTTSLSELESEQQRLESRVFELEAELRENQNRQNQTALETDRTRNRISYNRQQDQQLEIQIGQLESQSGEASQRARDAGERLVSRKESLEALQQRKMQLESAVDGLAARVAEVEKAERDLARRRDELAAAAKRLAAEISAAQVQSAQAQEALRHHTEALAQQEQTHSRLTEASENQSAIVSAVEERWSQGVERARQATGHLAELQTLLADRRREQTTAISDATTSHEQLAAARARQSSLEEILRQRAYTGATIQKLLGLNGDGERRGFHAAGLLSDYAEVEPQYETAVEQFLLDELDYVVVESFDSARAAIGLLRDELGGRATFFVDSLGSLSIAAHPESPIASANGVVAPMDRLVNFRRPLGEAAKAFLPRLRSAFLVESPAAAETLAHAYPEKHFVTSDGTWYHGRVVGGGKPGEVGPLSLKRELRELESETLAMEDRLAQCESRRQSLESEIAELSANSEQARIEALAAEKFASAAAQEREHALAERDRLAAELADCRAQVERWRGEQETAAARVESARRQIDTATRAREAAETEIETGSGQIVQLHDELASERDRLSASRADLAAITERVAAAESAVQAVSAEESEFLARVEQMRRERDALASRRTQLSDDGVAAQAELERIGQLAREIEDRGKRLDEEFRQSRARSLDIGESLRSARQRLDESREQRSRVEVESARMEAEIEHLRHESQTQLGVPPDEIASQSPSLSPEELAVAETSYREMKERLESMGPINMMALDEYKECDERSVFLTRERDDLLASIADTEQAIAELEHASRERFEQAFTQINANFTQAFTALFGGGTAEMRLDEPDSSGEQGLVIVAQPPGKRLQNVMLLSGGEKALAALALLIAIFRFQPSPFCVLDEVDAPLDESNVVRFNGMLSEMSAYTQFLVVTHNRRTMEIGSALYGVTMQEPGVSRIVSVRWEKPQTTAA